MSPFLDGKISRGRRASAFRKEAGSVRKRSACVQSVVFHEKSCPFSRFCDILRFNPHFEAKSSCLSLVPDAGFDHGKAAFAGSSAAGRRSDMPVRNEYEGE